VTQPQTHMPVPHQLPRNGLGDASFVLALASLLLVRFLAPVVFLTALTGVVLGLGGVQRLSDHTASNKALTWIGIGLNLAAIVIAIVIVWKYDLTD
jgi:hypothetical protein